MAEKTIVVSWFNEEELKVELLFANQATANEWIKLINSAYIECLKEFNKAGWETIIRLLNDIDTAKTAYIQIQSEDPASIVVNDIITQSEAILPE